MMFVPDFLQKIRWPLLARGTKGVGLDLIRFLTISSPCYSALRLCFYIPRGLKSGSDSATRSLAQDPLHHKKSLYFQACFQGSRNQKNGSPGLKKTIKNRLRNLQKNDFREKSIFAILCMRRPRSGSPKR